jgi:hypothetical protein
MICHFPFTGCLARNRLELMRRPHPGWQIRNEYVKDSGEIRFEGITVKSSSPIFCTPAPWFLRGENGGARRAEGVGIGAGCINPLFYYTASNGLYYLCDFAILLSSHLTQFFAFSLDKM